MDELLADRGQVPVHRRGDSIGCIYQHTWHRATVMMDVWAADPFVLVRLDTGALDWIRTEQVFREETP